MLVSNLAGSMGCYWADSTVQRSAVRMVRMMVGHLDDSMVDCLVFQMAEQMASTSAASMDDWSVDLMACRLAALSVAM